MRRRLAFAAVGVSCAVATLTFPQWTRGREQSGWVQRLRVQQDSAVRYLRVLSAGVASIADYRWTISFNTWRLKRERKLGDNSPADEKRRSLELWDDRYATELNACHQRTADRIVAVCGRNGGLFVKMAQYIASLNHALPPDLHVQRNFHLVTIDEEYTRTCAKLLDNAHWEPLETVERTLIAEFPHCKQTGGIQSLFREFDAVPLAAASLAQVHRAVTMDGQEVAVKVQHRDLRDRFKYDIRVLRFILDAVTVLIPEFKMSWVLKELEHSLQQELDFVNEARNSERAERGLQMTRRPKSIYTAHTPAIRWDLTTPKVLTAAFVRGVKVNDRKSIISMGLRPADVAESLIEIFSDQIFATGFVQADPHPGNVLVSVDSSPEAANEGYWSYFCSKWCPSLYRKKFIVYLLDHGLYQNWEDEQRLLFAGIWKSIVMGDSKTVQENCEALGIKDYRLFSILLVLRAADGSALTSTSARKQDIANARAIFKSRMNDVIDIMKSMPTPLLLILRTINLLRSTNKDLGPHNVNRYLVMARSAARAIARNDASALTLSSSSSLRSSWLYLVRRAKNWTSWYMFETRLALLAWSIWLRTLSVRLQAVLLRTWSGSATNSGEAADSEMTDLA